MIFLFTAGRNGENALDPIKPALKLKQKGVKIFVLYLTGQSRFRNAGYRNGLRYRLGKWRTFYVLRKIVSGSSYILSARSYAAFYRVMALLRLGKGIVLWFY